MRVAELLHTSLRAVLSRLYGVRLYIGRTLGARSWSHPLPAGRYRLTLEMPDDGWPLVLPWLSIDSGLGYTEAERIQLYLRAARPGWAVADIGLPCGARGLRFEPNAASGRLCLGRVRIRRVSRFERYGGGIVRLVRRCASNPIAGARTAWRALSSGGDDLLARLRALEMRRPGDYRAWIARHDRLAEAGREDLHQQLTAVVEPPLISVVLPVHNTPERLLREAIDGMRAQIYDRWELCIADDGSTEPHVRRVLEEAAHTDPRVKIVYGEWNGQVARVTNAAFDLATGTWTARLDPDDLLSPRALAEVALEIAGRPDAELIYTDEDEIDDRGRRDDPYFKPDFSRELLRSQNYLGHLTAHRTENIRSVGGWRPGFEGSEDYDLILRVLERIDMSRIRHIPMVLYHRRSVPGSTTHHIDKKGHDCTAGLRALEEHVARLGLSATVEVAPATPIYRLRPAVPEPPPRVSLVIPTRDGVDRLRRCIASIRDKTTYRSHEILVVDNGSVEEVTLRYLDELEHDSEVRVLPYEGPFNYSAINNFAVAQARGSIVGLVNDDVEVISPGWLTEMVAWATQPDVGCVGAKLYYANDTIQHAGVILGIGGVAGHSHKYFPRDHDGYFHRLKAIQNLSAVTAACLVVRKDIYEAVGGFNERDLPISFNDVDFCIRVREAGYLNVWTPYAELYHLESRSRGPEDTLEKRRRAARESTYMLRTWGSLLRNDPYYSPHLTRSEENFSLAT